MGYMQSKYSWFANRVRTIVTLYAESLGKDMEHSTHWVYPAGGTLEASIALGLPQGQVVRATQDGGQGA